MKANELLVVVPALGWELWRHLYAFSLVTTTLRDRNILRFSTSTSQMRNSTELEAEFRLIRTQGHSISVIQAFSIHLRPKKFKDNVLLGTSDLIFSEHLFN